MCDCDSVGRAFRDVSNGRGKQLYLSAEQSSCDCFLLCLENGWMKLSVVIYTPVIPAFRLLKQEDLKIKAGLRYTVEQTLSWGGRWKVGAGEMPQWIKFLGQSM